MIADVLDDSRAGRAAWNDVHGDGTDHVEHGAGGSALMNKRKLTSDTARKYRAFDLAGERRSIG